MTGNSITAITPADAKGIALAAGVLTTGGLVAVPTETVYGLAARADSAAAVAAVFAAKGRPAFNPLIVHVANVAQAHRLADLDHRASRLAAAFWPGPLTLVLPMRRDANLADRVSAGLPTVALRCPSHPVMQALLAESGLALAAPSANRSGSVSPTTAAHVAASLEGRIAMILDGGTCPLGIESTIVAVRSNGWTILRHGPILPAAIEAVAGEPALVETTFATIEAPGQIASHYSPGKPVRLNAARAAIDEFHIGFGTVDGALNLSASGDCDEAATNLYAALHVASAAVQQRIAVAPIPTIGQGVAINDRLQRAAA